MAKYDYLVVGAGLFGCVFAQQMSEHGRSVAVIEKRKHIGGNCYTEKVDGINVHKYGPHIFHTNNQRVWEYINRFTHFNGFMNRPIARYYDELYSLPFNMYTFNKMFGVITPEEAVDAIYWETEPYTGIVPQNLEEQALSMVGKKIYEKLVKEYTEKQWGKDCKDLPPEIIKRLPLRFTYDNNYFNALWQGIPDYLEMFQNLLDGIPMYLAQDYLQQKAMWAERADKILYTGPIDEFFEYFYGPLEYRSLRFETEQLETRDFQGNAVVNYTSHQVPWTRIVEHKHFEFGTQSHTIITREYSQEWHRGVEPFYPINNAENNERYQKYLGLANQIPRLLIGGRLGEYKYYDMDTTIESALRLAERELKTSDR